MFLSEAKNTNFGQLAGHLLQCTCVQTFIISVKTLLTKNFV